MPDTRTTGAIAGTSPLADDGPLTAEEVAELTGKHIQTVRQWVKDGRIRGTKVGRGYEIDRQSLEEFLGRDLTSTATHPQPGGVFDPKWGLFTHDPFRAV